MSRIDVLLDALGEAFERAGDIVGWPLHVGTIFPYFSDLEARDIFDKTKDIATREDPIKELQSLFIGPSVSKATLLMDIIVGMKVAQPPIEAQQREWYADFILDALESYQAGDIYCRDGRNLIYFEDRLRQVYEDTEWQWTSSSDKLVSATYRASASAQAFIWSIYFYGWTDAGFEIHGPYEVQSDDGRQIKLLVRDFFDVRPLPLWPELETFPYESIQIMTLHDYDADLHLDLFNHLTHKVNLRDSTLAVYVAANGQQLDSPRQIEDLGKSIRNGVKSQHEIISAMSTKEIVGQFIKSRYYAMRNWRLAFGEDWRPPSIIAERIEANPVQSLEGNLTWEMLRRGFDPRDEFTL